MIPSDKIYNNPRQNDSKIKLVSQALIKNPTAQIVLQ